MLLRQWLGSLDGRQRVALVAVVVLVLSAGCLGLGDSGDGGPDMNDNDTVDDPGENGDNDDNGTDNNQNGDDPAVAATVDDWQSQFEEFEDPPNDVSVDELTTNTLEAIDGVGSYEFTRTYVVQEELAQQQVSSTTNQETSVNVSAQEASYSRTVSGPQFENEFEGYLLNGTLYERGSQYESEYGSAWVKQRLNDSYQGYFQQFHVLDGLSNALENGSAQLEGTTELDGQTATVVRINVTESLIGGNAANGTNVPSVDESRLLMWISTSSNELLRAASYASFTRSANGQQVDVTAENEYNFEYVSVDLTLPEAAQNATAIDN